VITSGLLGFVGFLFLFGLSFLSDLFVILLARKLFREISQRNMKVWEILLRGILVVMVALVLFILGMVIPGVQGLLALLNLGDLLFLMGLFLVLALLVLHHSVWPTLCRPLYALQRAGVVAGETTSWALGLAFFSAGVSLGSDRWSVIWNTVFRK
jgi:uncharacterized membrane protein